MHKFTAVKGTVRLLLEKFSSNFYKTDRCWLNTELEETIHA